MNDDAPAWDVRQFCMKFMTETDWPLLSLVTDMSLLFRLARQEIVTRQERELELRAFSPPIKNKNTKHDTS